MQLSTGITDHAVISFALARCHGDVDDCIEWACAVGVAGMVDLYKESMSVDSVNSSSTDVGKRLSNKARRKEQKLARWHGHDKQAAAPAATDKDVTTAMTRLKV